MQYTCASCTLYRTAVCKRLCFAGVKHAPDHHFLQYIWHKNLSNSCSTVLTAEEDSTVKHSKVITKLLWGYIHNSQICFIIDEAFCKETLWVFLSYKQNIPHKVPRHLIQIDSGTLGLMVRVISSSKWLNKETDSTVTSGILSCCIKENNQRDSLCALSLPLECVFLSCSA